MALNININLVAPIATIPANTKVADIVVTGGTAPYNYTLATGSDSFSIDGTTVKTKAEMTVANIASFSVLATDSASPADTVTSGVTYPAIESALALKMTKANIIYKITRYYDLGHGTLIIPAGCTLDFQGGSFANGTIIGNNTILKGGPSMFYLDIDLQGSFNCNGIYPEMFKISGNDLTASIQKAFDLGGLLKIPVILNGGNYNITSSIVLKYSGFKLYANKATFVKQFNGDMIVGNEQYPVTDLIFDKLILNGNKKDGNGFNFAYPHEYRVSTVTFIECASYGNNGSGLLLNNSYITGVIGGDFNSNGEYGIKVENGNGFYIQHTNLVSNNIGMYITSGSYGVTLSGVLIQESKQNALILGTVFGCSIQGCYFEKNGALGYSTILLQNEGPNVNNKGSGIVIDANYIVGTAGAKYAIEGIAVGNTSIKNNQISESYWENGNNVYLSSNCTTIHLQDTVKAEIPDNNYIYNQGSFIYGNLSTYGNGFKQGQVMYDLNAKLPYFWNGTSWKDFSGASFNMKKSGTREEAPTGSANIPVGFMYFCTDRSTAEGAVNGIPLFYKGDGVYVDSLGRVVS